MSLDGGAFREHLKVVPRVPSENIVFDECPKWPRARDPSDPDIFQGVPSHDVIPEDFRPLRRRLCLISNINPDAVYPSEGISFNDPMMSHHGGDGTALRERKRVPCVLQHKSLHSDET